MLTLRRSRPNSSTAPPRSTRSRRSSPWAEARASDEAAKTTQAIAAVEAHNATLKADIEKLEAQLASAEIRASEESAKTAQAIAAFESLAQRLEAIAAARRPWWHRMLWSG
jgi:hypothetical protein